MRLTAPIALASLSVIAAAATHQEAKPPTPVSISEVSIIVSPGPFNRSRPTGMLLKKDGTAIYVVEREQMKGTYRAAGLADDFAKIERGLNDCNFWKMMARFGPRGMMVPMVTIRAKSQGVVKSVSDAGPPPKNVFGRKAPAKFREIEQVMTGIMQTAKWQKVSSKTDMSAVRAGSDE